jgi:hypothetical protein
MYSWICIRICTACGFMGTGLRRRVFPADVIPRTTTVLEGNSAVALHTIQRFTSIFYPLLRIQPTKRTLQECLGESSEKGQR